MDKTNKPDSNGHEQSSTEPNINIVSKLIDVAFTENSINISQEMLEKSDLGHFLHHLRKSGLYPS